MDIMKHITPVNILLVALLVLTVLIGISDFVLGVLLLMVLLILAIMFHVKHNAEITQYKKQFTTLKEDIKASGQYAINNLPYGIVITDQKQHILWHNQFISDLFGNNISDRPLSDFVSHEKNALLNIKERQFQLIRQGNTVFFIDITDQKAMEQYVSNNSIVIGMIFLDNYDEVTKSIGGRKKSDLDFHINKHLTNWGKKYNIYVRQVDEDDFIMIMNRTTLALLEEERFKIVDDIRQEMEKRKIQITVSMGIAYSETSEMHVNYRLLAHLAQTNLELALGRGGDQIVIKSPESDNRFYGGKTNPMEKTTRVRARMVSKSIQELMKNAENVVIFGHRHPDMDSIGSCLGIYRLAELNGAQPYIILNEEECGADTKKLLAELYLEEPNIQIVPESQVKELVSPRTLVIMVDHHRPSISVAPEAFERSKRLVIIDHHRRGQEFPKHSVLIYMEPSASSASELVTELFAYQTVETDNKLLPIEATALLAGIMVDTRNFTLRTGTRTFDAASYLKKHDADTLLIQKLLKEEVATFLLRSKLLETMEYVADYIAIAQGEEDTPYESVTISQTADTLLSMEHVEASFVVSKREDGRIGISARSLGSINVQRIMEELGGGGHLSNAATQLSDCTVAEAIGALKAIIEKQREAGILP